ncbi:DUF559 domain-containing protein [Microbacterium hibisci]|uniref:DUF559 domain-containing protein n=1 Tax=Microbacterium hibisci TaxID=2036000 RepID=UPI001945A525|nr:DUF559 domain-containing protein [Microbacterium hibisci]
MPSPAAPLPPQLGESFTCSEALDAGATRRRLRGKDIDTPFRGVRLRPEPQDSSAETETPLARDRAQRRRVLRLARAYRKIMSPSAFFAGTTAAVIWGGPLQHGEDLHVAVRAPARAPRRRGIRAIKISPTLVSVEEFDGLRVSSPASTWAMLARELSVRQLVVLGDAFVRIPRDDRGTPLPHKQLTTPEKLRRAAYAGRRRGSGKLRRALDLIRVGSASPLETEYRIDAEAAGLPEPELDVEIRDGDGRLLGIADAVYRMHRTIVEVEGDHHRTSRRQWNRDIEKHAAYAAAGWEVVRLTSDHIRGTPPSAVSIISAVLLRRGWTPG